MNQYVEVEGQRLALSNLDKVPASLGRNRAGVVGFCAVSATREHSQRLFTDGDVRPQNSDSVCFNVVGAIR